MGEYLVFGGEEGIKEIDARFTVGETCGLPLTTINFLCPFFGAAGAKKGPKKRRICRPVGDLRALP